MSQVFISYARDGSHGERLASDIQQRFQDAGITVFRDVIGLKPGDTFFSKLEFELDNSDLMVLVMSEKARTSTWVHNEFSMAVEIGIPVIPVYAERIRQPLWLRHLQMIDFCEQQNWPVLFNAVRPHLQILDEGFDASTKQQRMGKQARTSVAENPDRTNQAKTSSPASRAKKLQHSQPSWAASSGADDYGRYADLEFKRVIQRFRWIEPGTFWMGSPESEAKRNDHELRHQITLSKGFWLADTACTQALWKAVMGDNPAEFKDNENNPVENVSWDDAQKFLQTLNAGVSDLHARLPTEAEWEYACRAGTNTPFSFGPKITPDQVNYNGNYPYAGAAKGKYRQQPVAVKSLPANRWGLYEMHGNVWEWCQDRYGEYPQEAVIDPKGVESGADRVLRGGSWSSYPQFVRSADRGSNAPDDRSFSIGFRFALVN